MSDFDNKCPEYPNWIKHNLMIEFHLAVNHIFDGTELLTFFWVITSICILVICLVLYSLAKAIMLR